MDTRRFHSPEYKKQIRAVRGYKREARVSPVNKTQMVMHRLGLKNLFRQIFFVLVLVVILYLIYVPNFLSIKQLNISGVDAQAAEQLNNNFNTFKRKYFAMLPQKNLIFFDIQKFKNYVKENNHQISEVKTVKKKFPNTLNITATQRVPAYTLQSGNKVYLMYSDGKLGSSIYSSEEEAIQYFPNLGESPYTSLPKILDISGERITEGDDFFSHQRMFFLTYVTENFAKEINAEISHYEISAQSSNDLIVKTKPGFKVYFDSNTDAKLYLDRMFQVWSSLDGYKQAKLSYIDLRFGDYAYGCLKGDPCDK